MRKHTEQTDQIFDRFAQTSIRRIIRMRKSNSILIVLSRMSVSGGSANGLRQQTTREAGRDTNVELLGQYSNDQRVKLEDMAAEIEKLIDRRGERCPTIVGRHTLRDPTGSRNVRA
jgi:hypothetical protein